jgi:uncharacterized oxidoreductase
MQTTNNTILITGGTSGLGLAFAERFHALGNKVIICGRRTDRLAQIAAKHPGMVTKACDIADATERESLAAWVVEHHCDLNILMNNAGIQLAADLTRPVDLDAIRSEVETNFIAPVHLSSLLAGALATKKEAAIMNISSGLAFVPIAFMPIYCATKAALHSMTLSLRHQMRGTSVKVFEIAPPSTDTELGHQRRIDKTQSHGGMPIGEFLEEAMQGIETDTFETVVAHAKNLRAKREEMFEMMNEHFRAN